MKTFWHIWCWFFGHDEYHHPHGFDYCRRGHVVRFGP
jgi:hypothetical protein